MSSETIRQDHILLVDDEKHLLISLRDYLMFEHFTVTTAQSGEEALAALERVTPDLIVLDISMPGMGGIGFLKRISSSAGKPRYPVLVLTARSMLADFFQDVSVDGFVAKPCEEAELTGMIRTILAKRRCETRRGQRAQRTILLAENEATTASRLKVALLSAGYAVDTVGSGPELLEKAATNKPDIILMNEILPYLNGNAVATLLDVMPSTSEIPIVIYDDTIVGKDEPKRKYAIKNVWKSLRTSDTGSILKAVASTLAAASKV
jgi:DNA-binding response OmpR family regulator